METMGGVIWSAAIVLGPILLGLAILYGVMRTRGRSRDALRMPGKPTEPDPTSKYLLRLGIPVVVACVLIAVLFGLYTGW